MSASVSEEAPNGLSPVNGDAGDVESVSLLDVKLSTCEKARTVMSVSNSGTLCTVSVSEGIEGAPFGSFVDYVLDDKGNPVFLMNEMSMHTININSRSSSSSSGEPNLVTLFTQLSSSPASAAAPRFGGAAASSAVASSAQTTSRVSVTGAVERLARDADDVDAVRMRYSLTHAYADQVMDSPRFHFYRLRPSRIYFVGGFGVESAWVPVTDYAEAAPDVLASEAAEITAKLNRESGDDLRLVATHLLDVEEDALERVRVTSVDRLGMDVRVTRQGPRRRKKLLTDEYRLGFRIPVVSVEDAKSEIQKIFQDAWERGQGYTWGDDDELPGSDVPVFTIAEDSLG